MGQFSAVQAFPSTAGTASPKLMDAMPNSIRAWL